MMTKKKAPAKKVVKKAPTKKKAPAKKAPAKKVVKKAPTKKKALAKKKVVAKKVVKKAPAKKKVVAKKVVAKKVVKKAPAKKKVVAKKVVAKKVVAKKVVAKKAPAKKVVVPKVVVPKVVVPKVVVPKVVAKKVPPPPKRFVIVKGPSQDGVSSTKEFDLKFLFAQREELRNSRAQLVRQSARLEIEANAIIEHGEMGDVKFDDEGGEGDTMVVERERDLTLSAQALQTVIEIDEALARIKKGEYGYSSVSGLPIPKERLRALPWATELVIERAGGLGRK
ncbi:MAG: TraR/DksA family transcriptional regulator [Ilumatobacteraceae bacterium]|nr:TraR/DksA family transcriptional regulator [Ilumatobacteraceae bacterium]